MTNSSTSNISLVRNAKVAGMGIMTLRDVALFSVPCNLKSLADRVSGSTG